MNNGDESLLRYVDSAPLQGIDINTCSSMAECIQCISGIENKWDVVMINVTYKTNKGIDRLNSIEELFWDRVKEKCLSCFIVTDKKKFNPVLESVLRSRAHFCFLKNKEELFKQIKRAPEANLQKKYPVVCDFCSSPHLISLLQVLEGNNQVMPPTAIPNECRKLLEWTQVNSLFFGKKLPISIKDHLDWPVNKKTGKNCETYDELTLNDFSKALSKTNYVPEYVKRSFHHCCEITQDGSHLNEIDDLLAKGEVPYVNNSLIYNLLNILYWCATYQR